MKKKSENDELYRKSLIYEIKILMIKSLVIVNDINMYFDNKI